MDKNKSTIDLMSVITAFKTSVETKFSTVSDTVTAMQNTLPAVPGKIRDIEEAANTHSDKLAALESLCKTLQDGYEQHRKLADLESHSRI